jgi:HEAT repeat protein
MAGWHALLLAMLLAAPPIVWPADGPAKPPPGSPGGAADTARLSELLYNRSRPYEQSQAAMLLIQESTSEAQAVVRDGLRRYDRPDVFQALAGAIRLARDTRYMHPLLQALASDQTAVRQTSVDTLASLDPAEVVRWLLAVAEDAKAPPLARQSAATSLGRCLHKSAVKALLSLITNESQAVREAAGAALEEVSGHHYGTNAFLWQSWWLPYKDMPDSDWLAGRTAYLGDRARRLQDELQRAEAALLQLHQTLYAKIPATDRADYFQTLVQSSYPSLRMQAIKWIVDLLPDANGAEQKGYASLLLDLSRDGVETVQRQAVLMLEKVDDMRAFERVMDLLTTSTSPAIRAAAARSLGRCRALKNAGARDLKSRAMAALERALEDPTLEVVANVAESLGSLDVPEAAPILAGLLRHPSETVRQSASTALEQAANSPVLPALYAALDDAAAGVRFSLVGAIGKVGGRGQLGEEQYAEALKRLEKVFVADSDPGVRSRAATVIGDLGGPNELTVLWQRVRVTEDNRVQLKAWRAMIDILARSGSLPLVNQWDTALTEMKENGRRIELFTELRDRWARQDATKPSVDALTLALIKAQLAERKWQPALPLALDLAKRAATDMERRDRLHLLLVAGRQALDDKKPAEVVKLKKDIDDLLPNSKELAAEFAELLRRAAEMQDK